MVFEVIRRPLTSRVVFLDSSLDDDNKTEEVPQIYKSPSPLIRYVVPGIFIWSWFYKR